jgi:uncharacterized protein (TIGR00251 family)
MKWLQDSPDGPILHVRVTPRSAKTCLDGLHGEALKVRLQAPPVEGKANRALLKFLARLLGTAPSRLELISGSTGRDKRVLATGLSAREVMDAVDEHLQP